jgi:two-component system, NtrC family, C4-dicarboxylate transport sensor histidine kinase DctB
MNAAHGVAQRTLPRWVWLGMVAFSITVAVVTGVLDYQWRSHQRLDLLETEARRSSLEIMSTTLNGNLMGSVTLLGLMDPSIKQEATDGLLPDDANIPSRLAILGRAFRAEGVFVVGRDGIVRSSWDRVNKPSTGLDVRFRPYYQKAMDGKSSVYAAVSMARGDRSVYFSAPVYSEMAPSRSGIGAVVARTDMAQVDALLHGSFDTALLLSPQGVVFASSRPDWVGHLEGESSPQRLQEIRRLKQFGTLYEQQEPQGLPVRNHTGLQSIKGQTFAVAQADVDWNDPNGAWTLLILEDLSRTVSWDSVAWKALVGGLVAAMLGSLALHLWGGRKAQALATAQLQHYADALERHAENRRALVDLSTALQRCRDPHSFATTFFQAARGIVGVAQGTLYKARDDEGRLLVLAGAYACAEAPPDNIRAGEGLLGQVARERQSLLVPLPDSSVWTLRSGLGSTPMAALLMVPLLVQERLVGVVEMAFVQTPDAHQHETITELMSALANHLEILRRTLHLERQAAHHTDEAEDLT